MAGGERVKPEGSGGVGGEAVKTCYIWLCRESQPQRRSDRGTQNNKRKPDGLTWPVTNAGRYNCHVLMYS